MRTNISYPTAMIAAAKDAWKGGAKIVLVSDIASPIVEHILPFGSKWCDNCGGVGQFNLFIADEGPYQSPFPKTGKVSHWSEGAWYNGKSTNFDCPICKGLGYIRKVFAQREFA